MITKCALVIVYFTILFLMTRFLEFSGLLSHGMRCSKKHADTRQFNTKQLQKVLDHRGISYRHVIERPELMSLIDSSGNLCIILTSSIMGGDKLVP